tara:strand:- start:36751 stop:37608 length:858 start_codon:yes stop_codon:yes gene_type:complete
MRKKEIVISVLVGCLLLLLGAAIYVWHVTHPKIRSSEPMLRSEVVALAVDGWEYEPLTVPGAVLDGLIRIPKNPTAPWLLFFGGSGGRNLDKDRHFVERVIGGEDVGAAMWSYRGADTNCWDSLCPDAMAMVEHLRSKHGVQLEQLHVAGFSLGACYGILLGEALAAQDKAAASTTLIGLGLAAPGVPVWAMWLVRGPSGLLAKLDSLRGPILILVGRDDSANPVEHHARVAREILGDRVVKYLEVDGGHGAPLSDDAAIRAVRRQIVSRSHSGRPASESVRKRK